MFNFLSDQSVVDGINERVEHLVGERVGRIPTKFEVIIDDWVFLSLSTEWIFYDS